MFKDLELEWKGQAKTLKPTMDLLRYLENRNLGPHQMAYMRSQNNVAPTIYADFVASVLAYAGYSVQVDDVFEVAHSDVQGLNKLRQTVDTFIIAMLPEFKTTEKAPAKKKRGRPARTSTAR